jgi:hypothetical protein
MAGTVLPVEQYTPRRFSLAKPGPMRSVPSVTVLTSFLNFSHRSKAQAMLQQY